MVARTSMESQLKALKSLVKADTEKPRKPITRPSVLFDPKVAADLDIDSVFTFARSGFDVLVKIDERFINYKSDLFSHRSRKLDRELMSTEANNHINASIGSYLRLLSGHFQSNSALKTLEYLVRRYKIHVYNIDELILCALPYHDTHVFVRIVQLIDFRNTPWKFLDGVKASGAPPPRKVIVQQCTCDLGVLEVICNYATPTRKYRPSTPVISFSTAVVVEVLGSFGTVDSEIVKKVLPFLHSGLQSGGKGPSDYKAGTLMIVGLLAKKVALSPKLVSNLIRSVVELARADAQSTTDLEWVQLSIMALINIVQFQSVESLPKKAIDSLKEIKDLPRILLQLTKRFDVDRFLTLLLESFIDYSRSDSHCKVALGKIIETVPIGGLIRGIVSKLLSSCLQLLHKAGASEVSESGRWAKQILLILNKKYPNELRISVCEYLEDKKVQLIGQNTAVESLCKMLDSNSDSSVDFPDSRVWFALGHPKAEIRRAMLCNIDLSAISNDGVTSQRLVTICDAVAHCLSDEDLTVVQAALSLDKLTELLEPVLLLEKFQSLLQRCTQILWSGVSRDLPLASEVAVSCLKHAVFLGDRDDVVEPIARMIFPLLLVFPKTKELNLKALELAGKIQWPLYRGLIGASQLKKDFRKKEGRELLSAANMTTVCSLADVFASDTKELLPWLIRCYDESELSKTLVLFVILKSFVTERNDFCQLSTFDEAWFAFLKTAWRALEKTGSLLCGQEFDARILDAENTDFLEGFDENNLKELSARILVFAIWRSIKAYISTMPVEDDGKGMSMLRDLYVFFAESNLKHLFKEHRNYVVQNSKVSPVQFLSSFISEQGVSSIVEAESLHSFALLCCQANKASASQLLSGFPLILVPLSSEIQYVKNAAMKYVEELSTLCSRINDTRKKNGNIESWSSCVNELLSLLVQHKQFILSDTDFLASFLASLLSSSSESLLVPEDVGQKFDKSGIQCILDFILESALKFAGHAKLKILSILKELGGAILHVKNVVSLLCELLQRRRGYHFRHEKSVRDLSSIDVSILCVLIEICTMPTSYDVHVIEEHLLPALWIDGMLPNDPALVLPCLTFLRSLSDNLYRSFCVEVQRNIFWQLVLLYHDVNSDIQNATRDALVRLDISCSSVAYMLDSILTVEVGSTQRKKKKSINHISDVFLGGGNAFSFISSLLDILLLKKDMKNRALLIDLLFQLLGKAFSKEWFHAVRQDEWVQTSSGLSPTMSSTLCYIQQTVLLILEDIVSSLPTDALPSKGVFGKIDTVLLVDCARSATDVATRNHVFSLFAWIAKVEPVKFVNQIPEIIALVGESTVSHNDTRSECVFEDFISTVVPCWLSEMDGSDKLLEIFINVMPGIPSHRKLSIVLHLLKTLGESSSLGSLLHLLFRSLASKEKYLSLGDKIDSSDVTSFVEQTEWQYTLAAQICEQYTCIIWLRSLVSLLKKILGADQEHELFVSLLFALNFILDKLQDPELIFEFQSVENMETIQGTLCELMVQVISCWERVNSGGKSVSVSVVLRKELKELASTVLLKTTEGMFPSTFFGGIIRLLVQSDKGTRKKALQVLCETVRNLDVLISKKGRESKMHLGSSWLHLDGRDFDSFGALCLEILQLLDGSYGDLNVSEKLAAISALEVLANMFPSNHTVFSKCLACVVKYVMSDDLAVASCSLHTAGALINVLGSKTLPELPHIMKSVLKRTRDVSASSTSAFEKASVPLSVLVILEALVENLGAFLNPCLGDILELLVLHPDYLSDLNRKLKSKAHDVRRLLSETIPLRLAVPAIQNIYSKAVESGELSLSAVFELLEKFVEKMDKSLVTEYHASIFDLCMVAFGIRSQQLASIKDIDIVENHVINAMIALSMKMTERMFKPLFLRSIEWAELKLAEDDLTGGRNIRRAVTLYRLVNKLAENHRSLFVPYFKYLLEDSIMFLAGDGGKSVAHSRKEKKAKLQKRQTEKLEDSDDLSIEKWHLKALVLSSLHKCFLYDTASPKFLDSSKFQLLLKPIVSQLVVKPPALLEEYPGAPSVEEVNDVLVSCVGQMAVTAGSDLLWKPLNYEVLMQTRSEMVRSRLLGLRIVKHLVEHLKEEYLVLLAETIPFLGELLEDVELPVKTLAQDILKELESISGEDLRQYLQ